MRLAKYIPQGPLVFGPHELIAEFVRHRIPETTTSFGPCKTIGIVRRGILLGGVVYHEYQPRFKSIQVSYAFDSPRWLTRDVLGSICYYPYIQLGCDRVWLLSTKKNKRSRRLIEFIGFKLEGCARRGFGDSGDALLYGMLKHECRWIDHGQEITAPRAAAA